MTRERVSLFAEVDREASSALAQRPKGKPKEGEVSSREELLSRELVRCGSSVFCPNGLKRRFAKRAEDALVREAVSVTVVAEGVSVIRARLGEGGDDTEPRLVCTRVEDEPEVVLFGIFLGDTILSPKSREGDV